MNTVVETIGVIFSQVTFIILMLAYVWMGYTTNVELIFYVLQLFNQISSTFGDTLPTTFSRIAQFYACVTRINEILKCDDLHQLEKKSVERSSVLLENLSLELGNKEIFNSISMQITNPGLTIVTGSVGSGKSCLLKIILKEYQSISSGEFGALSIINNFFIGIYQV